MADYGAWKPYFDDGDDSRVEHGQQNYRLFRDSENPDDLTLIAEFESEDGAREFMESEDLPGVMRAAGVQGEPENRFLDMAEEKTMPQPSA
ncbi:hypothetical protein ACFQJ5_14525 [Halomicroarcula sp. GCM10025324]|uniref:hypothetical protein n=1 Tax=Haloarcula TaxID=2237 RepID=UPI0023E7AB0D|nr:hypothetical protein [Halomicroarcula sp. ZS-22-S1]